MDKKLNKRLIVVHGLVVDATDTSRGLSGIWEANVWGIPRKRVYGRAARALQVFLEDPDNTTILWGCAQIAPAVQPIARLTYNLAMMRAEEVLPPGADAEAFRWSLTGASIFADEAQTTDAEVAEVARLVTDGAYAQVIVVSCRSHIPRCLNQAMFHPGLQSVTIIARPADTDFGKSVVLEHHHRTADRPNLGLPGLAGDLFAIASQDGGAEKVHAIAAHVRAVRDGAI